MITGFNPADMYGVDHIRRVLSTFPGVFTGIGEFSVHKEFVSAKIPGETASLTNPAITNLPYDASGNIVRNNGFGAANGVAPARQIQLVTRLTF